MSDREPDRLFREGRYEDASKKLREGLSKEGETGRDALLYLLDLGLSLHTAGKFEESNEAFFKADRIAEIKDYTSLATESATLLTTDNIKDYKGEDFEKVLINTYLSMNFALMGNFDDALVEARRVNHKLHLMITDGQRKYKQNAFARYLSAIIYESQGEYNDAYVDYKNTWKIDPTFMAVGRDLWRMAWLLHMPDEMERWDEEFNLTKDDHDTAKRLGPKAGKGEVIVIYENGISPIKKPHPNFYQIPKFYPRHNSVAEARVEVESLYAKASATTLKLHDIEATAIENLDEKYGGMIARKLGGIVAKEVISDQIEKQTNSSVLGLLARVAFYASDQADVRSWNLLPKDLQIARIAVDPGTYAVRVLPVGAAPLPEKTVQVTAGKKVFAAFRYTP